jgi:hypothetical protein
MMQNLFNSRMAEIRILGKGYLAGVFAWSCPSKGEGAVRMRRDVPALAA